MKDEFVMVSDSISEGRQLLGKGLGRIVEQQTVAQIERAERHQGKPVALPVRKDPTERWAVPGGVHQAEGWNACLDEIAKLGPLYPRPVQGELIGYTTQRILAIAKSCPASASIAARAIKDDWWNVPLYSHADPARVECLKEIAQKYVDRNVDLSAQLAERAALLARVVNSGALSSEQYESLEAECCALSASAEPSAPVERDERDSFEKEFPVPGGVRFLEADNCYVDGRLDYEGGGSYQPAWEAWQARAALERKL